MCEQCDAPNGYPLSRQCSRAGDRRTLAQNMKPFAILILLLGFMPLLRADQAFVVENLGVLVTMPNGWTHDESDKFGFVLHPLNDNKRKIRIHLTSHKNISPSQAVIHASEIVNKRKSEINRGSEVILSSTPVVTKSGINGQRAVVGQQGPEGPSYLDRYYFEMSDGRIFCVCVYHYGDMRFSKMAGANIMETLFLNKKG